MADLLTAAVLRFDLHAPSPVVDAGDGSEAGRWERWNLGGHALFDHDGRLLSEAHRRSIPGKRFGSAWSLLIQPAGPGAPLAEGWIGRVKVPSGEERRTRRTAYELDGEVVAIELRTTGPLELDIVDPDSLRTFASVRLQPRSGVTEHLRYDVPYSWTVEFVRPVEPMLRCVVFAGMFRAYRTEVSNASVG